MLKNLIIYKLCCYGELSYEERSRRLKSAYSQAKTSVSSKLSTFEEGEPIYKQSISMKKVKEARLIRKSY